jgi:phosphoenolpyruvate phosphomutase
MSSLRKTTALRRLIESPELTFVIEAHNGLSAKIATEAGFPALWASSLTLSAALGVRDNNEISWTQVAEQVELMCDATSVPILVDGDSGHGDFNIVRRFVAKLGQRGAAGICLEDKLFPKTNSFLRSEQQPLADADEFSGKLKAALDARPDDDFVVIARTEALIAGRGMAEALHRAEAYRKAGVHAVVIHSKSAKPDEVFAFMREWAGRLPVVLIPTKYHGTPAAAFRENHVSTVIWANQLLRGATTRIQELAAKIHREESIVAVEDGIAPMSEIFRLQGDAELAEAESRYQGGGQGSHRGIILAATRGDLPEALTGGAPKALLKVGHTSILERLVTILRANEVRDITVVAGYKKEMIAVAGVHRIDNDAFATTGELASLAVALETVTGDSIVAFGDILFRGYIAGLLLQDRADAVIAVDTRFRERLPASRVSDFVRLTQAPGARDYLDEEAAALAHAEFSEARSEFHGEWIGLLKLSARGIDVAREFVNARRADGQLDRLQLVDLLNHLVATVGVKVHCIQGHWTDVDSLVDLHRAQQF